MSISKRITQFLVVAIVICIFALINRHISATISITGWHRGPEWLNASSLLTAPGGGPGREESRRLRIMHGSTDSGRHAGPLPEKNYSRGLVIPRMKDDDISWVLQELPDLNVTFYVANDPSTISPHSPKNKGHEVMVYLTYIIDHYNDLPDVILFMHAHRWAHHNNEFLGYDAPQMIKRLRNAHVIQQGYVNLRCHWSPGCPEWLHPGNKEEVLGKQEEAVLVESWNELFPSEPLPVTLAQPCCAQFALSRERIRSIPLSRFIFFRDWIFRTPLSDYISGRIWEYSWQYLFTGQGVSCPAEHLCYCEAFRLCFGGAAELRNYHDLQSNKREYERKIKEMQQQNMQGGTDQNQNTAESLILTKPDGYMYLERQVDALNKELGSLKKIALDRGDKLNQG